MGLAALILAIITVMFAVPAVSMLIKGIAFIVLSLKNITETPRKILFVVIGSVISLVGVALAAASIFWGMLCISCFDTIGTF